MCQLLTHLEVRIMEDWQVQMASEFQKRNNPKPISACIGIILATGAEWKVSIQNGKFMIDSHNGYICQHILGRSSKLTQTGSISTACPISAHGGSSYSEDGHVDLKEIDEWKAGNKVLVLPTDDNQMFFIVDILAA